MSSTELALVELTERELVLDRRIRARRWFVQATLLAGIVTLIYIQSAARTLAVAPVLLVVFAVATLLSLVAERRAREHHARVLTRVRSS